MFLRLGETALNPSLRFPSPAPVFRADGGRDLVRRAVATWLVCAATGAWANTVPVADPAASAASAPAPAASAPAAACTPCADAALPPVPPAPPVFQGLAWGVDERRIAERFGARLAAAECDAEARAEAERAGEWCESPVVPRYEVAGVPFLLRLHLDAVDRRLVRVTLTHTAEHGRSDNPRWSDHHRVLRRLLAQRYGGPESSDLQHEGALTTAQARWRTGLALIDLVSTFQPRSGSTVAREQVQITYQSPFNGEAAKL